MMMLSITAVRGKASINSNVNLYKYRVSQNFKYKLEGRGGVKNITGNNYYIAKHLPKCHFHVIKTYKDKVRPQY